MIFDNMRKYLLFILVFTISIGFAQQQETTIPQQNTTWEMLTYDVGNMFTSMGYSYTRPLHWKGNQWGQFGAVIGGTGLVYLFDEQTSDFLRNQKNGIPEIIREYGEEYGSPGKNYLFTGGVYLTGLFTKNQKLRRTGVLLVASASSAGLLQQVMKSVVGRARPVANLGKNTYDPFNRDRNFHTFPSGHGILAFGNSMGNSLAVARAGVSILLRSWAMPPARVPRLSMRWIRKD